MEEFNNVPSTGKYGDSIAIINQNFQMTHQAMQMLKSLVSPNTKYVTVEATSQTTDVHSVLPATGAKDTIYRVGKWDGAQYNVTCYTEYGWDGTDYVALAVKEYTLATSSDFNNPTPAQKAKVATVGSILDGADSEPTAGSDKLVKSGGVSDAIDKVNSNTMHKQSFTFSSAGVEPFHFIAGHTYHVVNTSNVNAVISVRMAPDSTSTDLLETTAHRTSIWNVEHEGLYLRCGANNASFIIVDTESIRFELSQKNGGLTCLIGMYDSPTQFPEVEIGDMLYLDSVAKICTILSNGSYSYTDPLENNLYLIYGILHTWSGTDMVPIGVELKEINLSVLGTNTGALTAGQFGYNTDLKLLKYRVTPTKSINVNATTNAIYSYDGNVYMKNGDGELINIEQTFLKTVPLYGIFGATTNAIEAGIDNGDKYYNTGVDKIVTIIDKSVPSTQTESPSENVCYIVNNGSMIRRYFYRNTLVECRDYVPTNKGVASQFVKNNLARCKFVEDKPIDSSRIPISIDFTDRANFADNLYDLFDSLVEQYPNLIGKHDAATEAGITYPSGFEYSVSLYKIKSTTTVQANKKRIFLYAGEHGNEIAAQYNLYLFAKFLCEEISKNYNTIKYNYDVWIIPCLCGYGAAHGSRINENGVNINRNFPRYTFKERGQGTADYTGETGGSEIETKIITGIVSRNDFALVIDHHNYSGVRQFYGEVPDFYVPILMEALYDVSWGLKEELPQYFAGNANLLQAQLWHGNEYDCISTLYFDDKGVLSAIAEISDTINYQNGVQVSGFGQFSNEVFSIAQFTLLRIVVRFLEYIESN